jgi:hypothetical protein
MSDGKPGKPGEPGQPGSRQRGGTGGSGGEGGEGGLTGGGGGKGGEGGPVTFYERLSKPSRTVFVNLIDLLGGISAIALLLIWVFGNGP